MRWISPGKAILSAPGCESGSTTLPSNRSTSSGELDHGCDDLSPVTMNELSWVHTELPRTSRMVVKVGPVIVPLLGELIESQP